MDTVRRRAHSPSCARRLGRFAGLVAPWPLAGLLACGGGPRPKETGDTSAAGTARTTDAVPLADSPTAGPSNPAPPLHVDGDRILAETRSQYSHIRVRQRGNRRVLAFVSENGEERHQTSIWVDDPSRLESTYAQAMFLSFLYRREQPRVLIVGLGGGAMVQHLHLLHPETHVDAVELDPEVVHLADEWFGVRSGPRTRIVAADGFDFLAEGEERWDVIYMDTFLDPAMKETDSSGVPLQLRTVAFLEQVAARLTTGGLVVFNLHFKSSYGEHLDAIRRVFPHVRVVRAKGRSNRIVVASVVEHPGDDELHARADALDREAKWGFSYSAVLEGLMPPLDALAPAEPAPATPAATPEAGSDDAPARGETPESPTAPPLR